MRVGVFSAALGLAMLAAAPAGSFTQEESASADDGVTSSTEIICRRQPAPTGSRIGGRNICKTQAQWDRINRESRDLVEEAQNRSKLCDFGDRIC